MGTQVDFLSGFKTFQWILDERSVKVPEEVSGCFMGLLDTSEQQRVL